VGAAGQLGRAVVRQFAGVADVVPLTRQQVDLRLDDDLRRMVEAASPDAIVNCAAYNAVDAAEDDAQDALSVNAFAVRAMAQAARTVGAVLVHYGSDFVFDGTIDRPYLETDSPQPQSTYGLSKLLGEWFAADAPDHYVLRVESLFGGDLAKSSVDRILDAIRNRQPARVFVDRSVTPSYVADVADATRRVLQLRPTPGVYHCVNSGVTTWRGIAEEIGRILNVVPDLVPLNAASVPMRAKRPMYCALANDKLRRAGIDMPPWQDALERYLRSLTP
jgi:dTDP-4-dehydrorhamnose reductase